MEYNAHPGFLADPISEWAELYESRETSTRPSLPRIDEGDRSPGLFHEKHESHQNAGPGHARTLSPVALLTPSRSLDSSAVYTGPAEHSKAIAAAARLQGATRRRSVDEMTALLDQMIADKVESGHLTRGERGSLRAKRDTVMEKSRSLSPPPHVVEGPTESGYREIMWGSSSRTMRCAEQHGTKPGKRRLSPGTKEGSPGKR